MMKSKHCEKKDGYVLLMVMGMLAALSAFGVIASKNALLDKKIAVVQEESIGALYQAQAGVKVVEHSIEDLLKSGVELDDAVDTLTVSSVGGLEFDNISNIRVIVPGKMIEFDVTGRDSASTRTLRVRYLLPNLVDIGVFGDTGLDTSMNVYSYRSSLITTPTNADSTGQGSVGSNVQVAVDNANVGKGIIDGSVSLGQTMAGVDASATWKTGVSTPEYEVGRVNPDPLELTTPGNEYYQGVNGTLPGLIRTYSTLRGNNTLTSGDYYVTKIDMKNNDVLTINGKVRIFMPAESTFEMKGDIISSAPENCQIYTVSSNDVGLYPKNDMYFFLYSPYAHVDVQPGNNLFGAIWAKSVDAQPPGSNKPGGIFVDLDLLEMFENTNLYLVYQTEID